MKVVSKSALVAFLGARMPTPDEEREWRRQRLSRMRRNMTEDRTRFVLRNEPRMEIPDD